MNQRLVINLKQLNQFIPYQHFKIEGLLCLKEVLLEVDYMCQLYLKVVCFYVPLNKKSRKCVRFLWLNIRVIICLNVWEDHGGSSNELSKCDIYSPVSCDKSEDININISSGNRIFGNIINSSKITFSLTKKEGNIREICLTLLKNPKQQ